MTLVIAVDLKRTPRDRTTPIGSLEIRKISEGAEICPAEKPLGLLVPLKSSAPNLRRKQACTEALIQACRVAVQQVLHNWTVVLRSDDPEGPHQMRVGLRRLRSALRAFRSVIDDKTLRDVDQRARNLGQVLSELRDADVLATDIVDAVLAQHEGDPGLLSLKVALAGNLIGHRQHVRHQLTRDEWITFQQQLLALPDQVGKLCSKTDRKGRSGDLRRIAGRALAKHWRRVAQAGRNLDQLTIVERHELRKELKVLRYTTELFSPVYPPKIVRRFSMKLRRLQDRFGYLNDVTVAEKLMSIRQDGVLGTSDLQRAVGYVIGWHAAHADEAWRDIAKDWRKLSRVPKFWSL
jgi:CHAD domain-containing protein